MSRQSTRIPTREGAIRLMCRIVGLVFRSVGDYSSPSDGFCDKCPAVRHNQWHWSHAGHTVRFVLDAVVEKLERDGYTPDPGMLDEINSEWAD